MLDEIEQYLTGPLANFAGLILGIVGIILAYAFYRKAKKDKEPYWAIQTVNLIRDYSVELGGVEVLYAGEKVKNLSISKLLFWNHGALTIDRRDIADADPLGICTDQRKQSTDQNIRLLDVKLLAQNHSASQVVVSRSPDKLTAQFVFDYLDRGHGFVVQIVHEGTSSRDIALAAPLKGLRRSFELTLTHSFINQSSLELMR